MIASVHVADVGGRAAVGIVRKAPKPASTPGLRHANVALTAPLSASVRPSPDVGRAALVAFWDDDAALDRFLGEHKLAKALAGGWRVRLAPLRAHGTWPGLPDDVPRQRTVEHDGPAAVLTLGRLRFSQAPRFFRTSAKAEGAVARGTRPHLGDRAREAAVRVDVLAVAEQRRALGVRVRCRRRAAPGRDRGRPGQAVPPRVGVHPLPAVRVRGWARRAQPAPGVVDGVGLKALRVTAVLLAAALSVAAGGSGEQVVTLDHVIDGDTIRLVDGSRVRLIGIDTPETDPNIGEECFGAEATAFAEDLLAEGDEVRLEFDDERRDQYGRTLAYVYRASDGLFVNAEMLRKGYATVELYEPNLDHARQFRRLERRARLRELGLWASCALS